MKDVIFFGGDSFTWGEGLELYIQTPEWVTQRNIKNTWFELEHKQTDESTKFREQNRFAGIVCKHFNTSNLVLDYNGGGFDASPTFFDLYSDIIPKSIVYQFTTFNRFNLHFTRFCKCDFCNSEYGGARPVMVYMDVLYKLINNIKISDAELFFVEWLKDNENITISVNDINETIDNLMDKFIPLFIKSMNIFVNNYIKKWETNTKIYLIDSWDEYTSNVLETIPELKSKIIPLKGYDDKWYYKWKNWEDTFPHKRIENEFPNTKNGHPTLLQHQYIAESIIHAMEK